MLVELERHQDKSIAELKAEQTVLLAVEHALQRAIQNVLDISMHVLSGSGQNDWDDYRGAIVKLGDVEILPRAFADRIADMAGLRNILVHGYIEVDLEKVQMILQHHLDDFRDFSRYIIEFLAREESND